MAKKTKTIKTYRALRYLQLQTDAYRKNGKRETIEFRGGTMAPKRVNGTFTTDDPEIQAYLENSDRFNVDYKIINEVKETFTEIDEGKEETSPETEKVEGVKDLQEARRYMVDKFGLNPESLKNKNQVLAAAKRQNLEFVDME